MSADAPSAAAASEHPAEPTAQRYHRVARSVVRPLAALTTVILLITATAVGLVIFANARLSTVNESRGLPDNLRALNINLSAGGTAQINVTGGSAGDSVAHMGGLTADRQQQFELVRRDDPARPSVAITSLPTPNLDGPLHAITKPTRSNVWLEIPDTDARALDVIAVGNEISGQLCELDVQGDINSLRVRGDTLGSFGTVHLHGTAAHADISAGWIDITGSVPDAKLSGDIVNVDFSGTMPGHVRIAAGRAIYLGNISHSKPLRVRASDEVRAWFTQQGFTLDASQDNPQLDIVGTISPAQLSYYETDNDY